MILSDKTGTITKNEMYMEKICLYERTIDKIVFKNILYKRSSVIG